MSLHCGKVPALDTSYLTQVIFPESDLVHLSVHLTSSALWEGMQDRVDRSYRNVNTHSSYTSILLAVLDFLHKVIWIHPNPFYMHFRSNIETYSHLWRSSQVSDLHLPHRVHCWLGRSTSQQHSLWSEETWQQLPSLRLNKFHWYFFVGVEGYSRYTSGVPILIVCSMDFWRHVVKDTENPRSTQPHLTTEDWWIDQHRLWNCLWSWRWATIAWEGTIPFDPWHWSRRVLGEGEVIKKGWDDEAHWTSSDLSRIVCLHNFDGDFVISGCIWLWCVSHECSSSSTQTNDEEKKNWRLFRWDLLQFLWNNKRINEATLKINRRRVGLICLEFGTFEVWGV